MSTLTTTGLITLFQLDTTMLPNGQWFYFTSAEDSDTVIQWGGQPYSPLPMQAEGFETTTRGAMPQPNIVISNVYGAGTTLLLEYQGLLGAKLTRIVTLRRFLDDGDTPDPGAMISRDVFVVAQKTSHNAVSITFKLSSAIDQQGVQLPRRQILRDLCSHVYRQWIQTGDTPNVGYFDYSLATCPWTGSQFVDINDNYTVDYADQCSRTFLGCARRFHNYGVNYPLPAYFFPSVGKIR